MRDQSHHAAVQQRSRGLSPAEIHSAALSAARPEPGLSWLDVGCGTGGVLREILERYQPATVTGIDVVDFLAADLRERVTLFVDAAEKALLETDPADRVLLVESLHHVEAPWSVLRQAARLVRPGGALVLTTVNAASLRHRLELLVRGQLTGFRPEVPAQMTPLLPHVIGRILEEEGLSVRPSAYAGGEVVPYSGGRLWPEGLRRKVPRLLSVSLLVAADAPSAQA